MRPSDRLCSLQMGVAWHYMLDLLLRSRSNDLQEVRKVALKVVQLIPQPESHVRSHLIIPASSGVKLTSNVFANDLT